MQYFPVTLPFLFFLLFLFVALIILIEINILRYAYEKIGVNRHYVFALLLFSLLGSYINIPVYHLPGEEIRTGGIIYFYGVPYVVPEITQVPGTIIAVNLGGAVIPTFLSLYLIVKNRLFLTAPAGTALAAYCFHQMAHLVPGLGIAMPVLIPALVSLAISLILSRRHAPALAYIVGSLGTLIGADLINLKRVIGLGAPVVSIGGAGTFDGIFLIGILAVLLASLMNSGDPSQL
jgi:uncharacterized membrane protein